MTLTIKHATLSNVPDEGVPGEIGPSEWNEGHTIAGADPIVILATGQSNFTRTPAFTWTPADNCFVWNWDGVDGHVGTAFVAVDSTVMNVARRFASDVAKVNATRSVYLINISFSGQDISHWQTGASAPDVFQNILNNITPALAAIGRTEIDALIWWQGETQTSTPDNYVADWETVYGRFTGQSWFPRATPVIVFGLAPTTISGTVRSDVTNSHLQTIVRNDLDMRMFVYPGTFGASLWEDTVHMTAEGYNRAGKMAANEFVYGPGRNILLDPVTGYIRSNVIGRPAFRNLILGGDFTTAPWQRGTSFTSVGTTSYTADRWTWVQIGSGVIDIAKTADAPTIAQAGMFTQHCLDVAVTTADASIAANDVYVLLQRIEGLNSSFLGFGQLNARRITVSFWVKSSKIGTFYVTARNNGNNRTYTTAYAINAADTWEFKSFSIPGDTSGTWLYTNGVGLSLTWTLADWLQLPGNGGHLERLKRSRHVDPGECPRHDRQSLQARARPGRGGRRRVAVRATAPGRRSRSMPALLPQIVRACGSSRAERRQQHRCSLRGVARRFCCFRRPGRVRHQHARGADDHDLQSERGKR